jgi:hypothetical protein
MLEISGIKQERSAGLIRRPTSALALAMPPGRGRGWAGCGGEREEAVSYDMKYNNTVLRIPFVRSRMEFYFVLY